MKYTLENKCDFENVLNCRKEILIAIINNNPNITNKEHSLDNIRDQYIQAIDLLNKEI